MVDGEAYVGGFSGVVEAARSIQRISTRPEKENCGVPASATRLFQQSMDIMRAKRALEAVQKNQQRGFSFAGQVIKVEEISVGCVESLATKLELQSWAHELPPECLQI